MRSSLRFAVVLGGACLLGSPAEADEPIYRYRGPDGREVFTNAGNRLQAGGTPLTEVALPALSAVNFDAASAQQLQSLDRGVVRAHEDLQAGERCEAIRASSRVPMRTFFWRGHLRELAVSALLGVASLLVLVGWSGRLRGFMPLPTLLGGLFLGYATYARVDHERAALHEGLRACSSELPAGHSTSPSSVKQRLESALSLQNMVDRAYSDRAARAELVMKER
jgi:hypothetical protein